MVAATELAQPAATPLLSVSGLGVSFGTLRALDGVNFTVRPGEIVALAGENGAGKSTLVRCIAGDIAPDSGRILIAGERVGATRRAVARRGVAVVWQDLALCDNLDVASNLLLGHETRRCCSPTTRFHATAAALLDEPRHPAARHDPPGRPRSRAASASCSPSRGRCATSRGC